jgi:thiosulfate reductase cytochrome b subunit
MRLLKHIGCLAALWLAAAAWGADPTNDCLVCHSNEHLAMRNADGTVQGLYVEPDAYFKSVHGKLTCAKCHGDLGVGPHADGKLPWHSCLDCHLQPNGIRREQFQQISEEYARSYHARTLGDRFSCFSCHDPHTFNITLRRTDVPQTIERDNGICIACHRNPERFGLLTDRPLPDLPTIHAWLPSTELHWKHVRCVECHTPNTNSFNHEILDHTKAERKCVACHSTNSILLTKLYSHRVAETRTKGGFLYSVVFNDAYIIGMTRNVILDHIVLTILCLMLLAFTAHAGGRWVTRRKRPAPSPEEELGRVYLYPRWVRAWHWANAFLCITLGVTGFSMHYAQEGSELVGFRTARAMHNVAGVMLAAMYVVFVLGNWRRGNGRHYIVRLAALPQRMFAQALYYVWGIFRGQPAPFHPSAESKFNPLQQLTYVSIMYGLVPILVITGLFLLFPGLFPAHWLGGGGIWPTAVLHTVLAYAVSLFMIGHIYLATNGSTVTKHFLGMITGWHEEEPGQGHEHGKGGTGDA